MAHPSAANNGNVSCNSTTGICVPSSMTQPRPAGCGAAVAQGAISFGLDVVGAIPGVGNAVSATAAGARAVNGIVAYGGAAYGIATGLPDENPFGAASAGAGLGLTLADSALEGGKVIPGRVAQVLILLTLSTQWVPRPSRFLRRAGTTNVCSGAELGHSMAERNLRPALVHAHRPRFVQKIETITAPPPLLR